MAQGHSDQLGRNFSYKGHEEDMGFEHEGESHNMLFIAGFFSVVLLLILVLYALSLSPPTPLSS